MYPTRDFKYLINQPNTSHEFLITALRREPFTEILTQWTDSNKPDQYLYVYQKGIEEAIAKDRYPLYQLDDLRLFPEFASSALNGLKRLWTKLRFSLNDQSLLIDSIKGQDIIMNAEKKLKILDVIPYKMSVVLLIENQEYKIGLFASRRAEQLYRLINMLESIS
jgi:uncharacterized protein (DUF1919 family)